MSGVSLLLISNKNNCKNSFTVTDVRVTCYVCCVVWVGEEKSVEVQRSVGIIWNGRRTNL